MENNLYEKLINICVKNNDVDSIHYFIDVLCSDYQRELDKRDKLIDELNYIIDRLVEIL